MLRVRRRQGVHASRTERIRVARSESCAAAGVHARATRRAEPARSASRSTPASRIVR
jgi:hypothetical protein